MANNIFLTISGNRQGLISSGCSTLESIGNRYQTGHEDEIFIYKLSHNISRAENVMHNPIVFIKPLDKSSPLLVVAISENELLNLKFDFYRTSQNGAQEKYYTVECREATLADLNIHYPHSLTHVASQPEEIISVRYKDIICQHHTAGTSGYSVWGDRVF
ncbi:Hcp family type VI secretion system effector [Yersinia aldovae]|uniref:Hcp1 family type VI secretion system effector n=1 Tax=Yersinia aldovae TaxID=29483 RepID=A0ABM9STD7_YERAL|nr:Hcp family type VI secretion system effector [Yersinia aldovae]CNL02794.1 Hcp1 family type VI secretion system effector [Yersinia aldovae]